MKIHCVKNIPVAPKIGRQWPLCANGSIDKIYSWNTTFYVSEQEKGLVVQCTYIIFAPPPDGDGEVTNFNLSIFIKLRERWLQRFLLQMDHTLIDCNEMWHVRRDLGICCLSVWVSVCRLSVTPVYRDEMAGARITWMYSDLWPNHDRLYVAKLQTTPP